MTEPHRGVLTGQLLGDRYEVQAPLGEGGMGVVYQGWDTLLGREVAVKVFRDDATEVARTASEMQLLAGLNHPSLVTLYDAHVGAEAPRYLVMEYVHGPTLEERLVRGPLSDATTARIAGDLAEALHVVHEAGIVHRDIKPANVLLRASTVGTAGEEYHAKLVDFGIAYLIDTTRLTTPGTIIGSAAYLSPEQVTGAGPVPASDIYSLGLVLLEALTGRRAFAQDGMREAVLARLAQDPVVPASVGHEWGTLLTAMTARDPADRPSALDVVIAARGGELPVRSAASTATAASAATVAQPGSVAGATTRTAVLPRDPGNPTAEVDSAPTRRPRWLRWLAPLALAAVVVAVVVGGMSMWGGGTEPAAPPDLPAVEEPLASHLQQLLDAVTP